MLGPDTFEGPLGKLICMAVWMFGTRQFPRMQTDFPRVSSEVRMKL